MFCSPLFQGMFITLPNISNYKYEDKYFNQTQKTDVVCEESGPISLSYNVLLTTIVKPLVLTVTIKSTLTCTNCG